MSPVDDQGRLLADEEITLGELIGIRPSVYVFAVTYPEHNHMYPDCDRDDLHEHADDRFSPFSNVYRFDPAQYRTNTMRAIEKGEAS